MGKELVINDELLKSMTDKELLDYFAPRIKERMVGIIEQMLEKNAQIKKELEEKFGPFDEYDEKEADEKLKKFARQFNKRYNLALQICKKTNWGKEGSS